LTKFADQLFDDLMREHGSTLRSIERPVAGQAPARRRRAVRPAWLTAAGTATAGAVAVGMVIFGGGAAPAYAVTEHPNGTVSIAIKQASAIDAANAKLKAIGTQVVVVPVRPGCPDLGTFAVKDPAHHATTLSILMNKDGSITVAAKGVPAGETLVVGFDGAHGSWLAGTAVVKGKVPACVSLPAAPTGSGSSGGSGGAGTQSGAGDQGTAAVH
jgi:hypothetical protein